MAKSAISTPNVYELPTPKPGHRFAPVKVGRTNKTSVICLIECPTFCTEDHVAEPVCEIADVMHRGGEATVLVPTFGYGAYPVQLNALIESDPIAEDPNFRNAHISVVDASGGEGSRVTADMAERLADDLIGFASELRHMARTVRLANQTAADSDPDMDEALRRVREGRTA